MVRSVAKDEPTWLKASCFRCAQAWYGIDRAHCSACCRTFDLVEDFDGHRANGSCSNPVALGLYRHEKSGIWMRHAPVVARRQAS